MFSARKKQGIKPSVTLDTKEASKIVICKGNSIVGKLTESPENGIITFSSVAVGFEKDGSVLPSRVASIILTRAYVTLKNNTTGESISYYSALSEKDLTSACEATLMAGIDSLDQSSLDFLRDLISIGVDVNYIYTKDEALAHLTSVYNDPDHLLSGQLSKDEWKQLLKDGYTAENNDVYTSFMTELSAIADFFEKLEDRGVTVFWRPYHEMNGGWFWWGGPLIPGSDVRVGYFKDLWIMTYDYFVNERGLENLIWVYSLNAFQDKKPSSSNAKYDVMQYYPGDVYVDVAAIDVYHSTDTLAGDVPVLNDDSYAENWSRLAGKYTGQTYNNPIEKQMPVVYGEFGPSESLRDPDPTLSYGGEDALGFVKKVAGEGRNMGWIVFWNGWTDNWLSLDLMCKADVFMQDDFILDLDEARTLLLDTHY